MICIVKAYIFFLNTYGIRVFSFPVSGMSASFGGQFHQVTIRLLCFAALAQEHL